MRAAEPLRRPRSPGEIFRVFNRLALQGFGGVLPVAQHHLVERECWLGKEEFVELLSIGQVLPGPNIVNLALMFGDRFFGWRGALAALAGMLLVPMALVLAAASLYARFAAVPAVAGALRGMGAVAAGLVLATALRLAPALKRGALGRDLGYAVGLATFGAVGLLHWPLVWIVLGLGGASCALTWWRLGR